MTLPRQIDLKHKGQSAFGGDLFLYKAEEVKGDQRKDVLVVRIGDYPSLKLYVSTEDARLALIKALGGKDDPVVSEGV